MTDTLKKIDQIALLKIARDYTDTGKLEGCFTYPNCGYDLVRSGLATEDAKITTAGRAALYLLGEGDDPLPDSASFLSMSIPLPAKTA